MLKLGEGDGSQRRSKILQQVSPRARAVLPVPIRSQDFLDDPQAESAHNDGSRGECHRRLGLNPIAQYYFLGSQRSVG